MSPPKEKIWAIDGHTKGKHLVLRAYLNAWLPILGSWNGRILFIDAFAGPGEYKDGEEGSPIIALNSLIEHNAKNTIKGEIIFLFIENRKDRYEHLKDIIENYQSKLPSNAHTQVIFGSFDEAMTQVLDTVEEQNTNLAPSFVMIDPFGISGTPMNDLKGCDVMKNAIWKIVPSGNYRFVGTNSPQLTLSIDNPNFAPLKEALQDRFIGKGWVRIEDVIDFVMSDETDYHSGQVKTKVLRPMEKNKEIEGKDRSKSFTYPERTKIKFLDKSKP